MNYEKILKDNLIDIIGKRGYFVWKDSEPEIFLCIEDAMKQVADECKKALHKSLEENVSFDNENEKSNFIIEIMGKVNSL